MWYKPPLLRHIHLVLEVSSVSGLRVLDLPAEVLYLRLQLSLLILKLQTNIENSVRLTNLLKLTNCLRGDCSM